MPSIESIHIEQNRSMDALIASFEDHLRIMVGRAQARVTAHLQKKLVFDGEVILSSPGNNRVLRTLDAVFVREMNAQGYESLVNAFIGEFPGFLPYLNETLQSLSDQMKNPLPISKLTAADNSILASLQANATTSLEMAMEGVANSAVQSVLMSVGGLRFGDLVEMLTEKLGIAVGRAKTLADSSMAVWFRTATDRAFQAIEKGLPEQEQRYRYTAGPDDEVTRRFCRQMIALTNAGKTWTRDQIGELSNGQLPAVFITCGGWNCRHAWLLAIPAQLAKAA